MKKHLITLLTLIGLCSADAATTYANLNGATISVSTITDWQATITVDNQSLTTITLPANYNLAPYNWGYSIDGGDMIVAPGSTLSRNAWTWSTGGQPAILANGINIPLSSIPEPDTAAIGLIGCLLLLRRKR